MHDEDTYIELSIEILEMLKSNGYHSVMHIREAAFGKSIAENARDYYVLKPSLIKVDEDTLIDVEQYSPILSDDIKDMAKNNIPFIDFLLVMDTEMFKVLDNK